MGHFNSPMLTFIYQFKGEELPQYSSDKQKMFYTCPLNPPILGDFEIRTPLSTLPDRAISWGAGGPSAIMVRLAEQYWDLPPFWTVSSIFRLERFYKPD
jgi:hypothetical protein